MSLSPQLLRTAWDRAKELWDSVHIVTAGSIGVVTLSNAETWTKILSAAIPALVATAYTIWKWRKDADKK